MGRCLPRHRCLLGLAMEGRHYAPSLLQWGAFALIAPPRHGFMPQVRPLVSFLRSGCPVPKKTPPSATLTFLLPRKVLPPSRRHPGCFCCFSCCSPPGVSGLQGLVSKELRLGTTLLTSTLLIVVCVLLSLPSGDMFWRTVLHSSLSAPRPRLLLC